jgi:hypothetical protein
MISPHASLELQVANSTVLNVDLGSIYMAPTSLKGSDTMGIYTTRDMKNGEHILTAPDGPSITLLTDVFRSRTSRFPASNWLYLWGEYAWGRGKGVPDHISYEAYRIMEFQITTGALPNHHCLLDSISYDFPAPAYDDSRSNHRQSPGTGAYSYNKGRDFHVDRAVKGGEELFLNYGKCTHDRSPEWAKGTPMPSDYAAAIEIMSSVWKNLTKNEGNAKKIALPANTDPFVAMIVPKSTRELKELMSKNYEPDELKRELALRTGINRRSPEWIRSNGKCLEHMVQAPSQLPHAGLGGIAQHYIAENEVIVPAPLVHIMDEDVLSIYGDNGAKIGDQVVLNYCYGHRESTLLLCPNTNAILINHCGKRSKNCSPNAVMRWSNGWDPTSDEWRKGSLKELSLKPFRGLSMEIVATRNIVPGEEVLMDYGDEWDEAWKKHVASWKPKEPVLSAKEANDMRSPPSSMLSGDLRSGNWTNPHLFSACLYWKTDLDTHSTWDKGDPNWTNLTDSEILRRYADDGSMYSGSYEDQNSGSYWPCVVIREEAHTKSSKPTFTVRMLQIPFEDDTTWTKNRLPRFLTNYSRSSIQFFVRRGMGDQYLPGVFRHKIGIPDDVFPSHWKNKAE